jgi:hypothetical protein
MRSSIGLSDTPVITVTHVDTATSSETFVTFTGLTDAEAGVVKEATDQLAEVQAMVDNTNTVNNTVQRITHTVASQMLVTVNPVRNLHTYGGWLGALDDTVTDDTAAKVVRTYLDNSQSRWGLHDVSLSCYTFAGDWQCSSGTCQVMVEGSGCDHYHAE